MQVYLDYAATTPLSDSMKTYLTSVLNQWGNPSSLHAQAKQPRQIIDGARRSVAAFLHADTGEITFVPSGSAGNTLAVKGLTSENPFKNRYAVFYSPTSHKSMQKACESCLYSQKLTVNSVGEIDLSFLSQVLQDCKELTPFVCVEAGNSEIGTINDIPKIGSLIHKHNGILAVDATGYIPSCPVDMRLWRDCVDLLTFSGHKLHALTGIGVLWKHKNISLRPLSYGTQENGLTGGTENVLGIASLGKAVADYRYPSSPASGRDALYHAIIREIPDCYLVGPSIASQKRLPHNLYMCFRGVEGESLLLLLDLHGVRVSTGSACTGRDLEPSPALSAIGMPQADLHSCIRMTLNGQESQKQLDYVCETIKQCVESLRLL